MSMLLRPSTTGAMQEIGAGRNDDSVQAQDYRVSMPQMYGVGDMLRDTDVLWTRTSMPGGGQSGIANGVGGIIDSCSQQWEWNFPLSGGHSRKNITGFVYNAAGAPVPNAVVKLFNTATNLLVDSGTTAGDGSYTLTDPNNVACYIVTYLAGAPDTMGTTVNTLTGT